MTYYTDRGVPVPADKSGRWSEAVEMPGGYAPGFEDSPYYAGPAQELTWIPNQAAAQNQGQQAPKPQGSPFDFKQIPSWAWVGIGLVAVVLLVKKK